MTTIKEDNYDSVCVELDQLSLIMLDSMKEYIDCKVLIENYIKTGSLHLAKARYIMGNKNVSSLQLPTEDCDIHALTRISHSKQKSRSTENLVFEIDRLSLDERTEKNGVNFRGKKLNKNNCSDDNMSKDNTKKMGKSKKSGDTKETNDKDYKTPDTDKESTFPPGRSLVMSKDPLKWFGVLVPQNLKYAQTNFSTCLDYVIQCVNLQVEMDSIRSKYTKLLELKKKLTPSKE